MKRITYADLVERFGKNASHDLLLSIEKMAKLSRKNSADEESRLQRCFDSLAAIDLAT